MPSIFKVITEQVRSAKPFCSWSLDATSNEKLFEFTLSGNWDILSASESTAADLTTALAILESRKPMCRSHIDNIKVPVFILNSCFTELGIIYITETDSKGVTSIVRTYVKRPEFSVEQLAEELYGDFAYGNFAALGNDAKYDRREYPNMLEKFVKACEMWWDNSNHYSYNCKEEVLQVCRKVGVFNNLQTISC